MPTNNPQQTTPQQQIARAAEGASKAAERLEHGAEAVTNTAIEKVRQVREEAESGIEQQRAQVAKRIRRISGVLLATSDALAADDALSQQLFETVGARVDRVADYISNVTPGELASDVQSLARRQPGLFFGGSFILGLALGRFAKSSASALASAASEELEPATRSTERRPRGKQPRQSAQSRQNEAQQSRQKEPQQSRQSETQQSRQGETQQSRQSETQQRSTSSLPQGVGSSNTATVGVGSAQGSATNAAPAYGAGSTAASKPQAQGTPASSSAHSTERGEGTKS